MEPNLQSIAPSRLKKSQDINKSVSLSIEQKKFLVVDLDYSLIKTDLLYEAVLKFIKDNPLNICKLVIWCLKGKLHLKQNLAKHIQPSAETLPYNEDVIQVIKKAKCKGKSIILATATHIKWAKLVAQKVNLFDLVLASENKNLKSLQKLSAIQSKLGNASFDYIGDSLADFPLFNAAKKSYLVNPSYKTRTLAKQKNIKYQQIGKEETLTQKLKLISKAIRVHQWTKNVLVSLPAITAHQITNNSVFLATGLAFISFSLTASAVYLLNDLFDLDADRSHHSKYKRPLASGNLKIPTAIFLSCFFLATSFFIASFINLQFVILLLGYFSLTLAYSLRLKQLPIIDTLTLSGLFCTRIFAGGTAANIIISNWLIAFSSFLFFSLAVMKRCIELQKKTDNNTTIKPTAGSTVLGRGYIDQDLNLLKILGCSSGYLCVLVFALYLQNPSVASIYQNQQLLWLACPFLFYWISNIWFLANRGLVNDDPIVFSLKDSSTYVVTAAIAAIMVIAK